MQPNQSVHTKSGAQDKTEGTLRNIKGKIKEDAGKVLGNPHLEAQGDIEQVDGTAQKKVGEIKSAFGK